jgi:hypothetical protein
MARCVQALTAYFQAKITTGTEPADVLNGIAFAVDGQSTTVKDWRVFVNSSNSFLVQENTGTDAVPVWTTRLELPLGGGLVSPHASTHIAGGSDPITTTASRALETSATGELQASAVTAAELAFLSDSSVRQLTWTDAGAAAGPALRLLRSSASPAASDLIGALQFLGKDSGGTNTTYGSIQAAIVDPVDGTEDGQVSFNLLIAGALTEVLRFNSNGLRVPLTTASTALITSASKDILSSVTTSAELAFLSGVTSAVQTQLDARLLLAGGVMSGNLDLDGNRLITTADGTGYIQGPNANAPLLVGSSNGTQFSINTGGLNDFYWTDSGAAAGPRLRLLRNSSSPATSDLLANVQFYGKNSAAADVIFASIDTQILDATSTSEDGLLALSRMLAGTLTAAMTIGSTMDAAAAITFPAGSAGAIVPNTVKGIGSNGFSLTLNCPTGGYTIEFRNAGTVIADVPSTGLRLSTKTADTVPYLDSGKILQSSAVTPTELGYVSGVTSAIQTQINAISAKFILLNSYSPSTAASVDITSQLGASYDVYLITFNLRPATDAAQLLLRTDTSNGASFDTGASDYTYHGISESGTTTVAGFGSAGDTSMALTIGGVGSATNEGVSGRIWIDFRGSASMYPILNWTLGSLDQSTLHRSFYGGGSRLSAAAIDAVQLLFSSGNIASGTVRIYGLRNS